jgi:hypothetical protein
MKCSSLVFSALVLFLAPIGTLNAKTPAWTEKAMGQYPSQIWSGGSLVSGTTELQQAQDGTLGGTYSLKEPTGVVPGKLSQCQAVKLRVLRCGWTDQYGSGTLEMTFSEDFSGFNGYWAADNSEPVFRWSGSR